MNNSSKFGKNIATIHPGEYYVSSKDEYIQTLLGSCVAVCFYDSVKQVSGMNHFMLAGNVSMSGFSAEVTAKHGMQSTMLLLEDMYKFGCTKKNIIAKVFGGGKVLPYENPVHNVPGDNIRVAKVVLEMEDIVIDQTELGGNFTRKLIMDVKTGKVFLKKSVNYNLEE